MDYGRLIEGSCPTCGAAMERCEDHGRCPDGHGCLSIKGDTLTLHLHVASPDL